MNKRRVGAAYEKAVGLYLEKEGYRILRYNFRCRFGEVDIIARDGPYLVFAEVKYRSSTAAGVPQEAVNAGKQRTICRVALYYCATHGYDSTTPCRFDVAAVMGNEIQLIKNAFDYCDCGL